MTHTMTSTIKHFADPYKRCQNCFKWVDGARHWPNGDVDNYPCGCRLGYDDLCPSWSPVDGCRCDKFLGYKPHPERPKNSPTKEADNG